ncbi:MAG: LuxR C-terminal-related transcriptional regulator [Dysgonamonadaceae bacterium]
MALLHRDTLLSDVVIENHLLIPFIYRFGIRLGMGEQTIGEVCTAHSIHCDFFLTLLNTFVDEDYFPEKKLQTFDISQIVGYLAQVHAYTVNVQIVNVEKHLNAFIAMSDPSNQQLLLIRRLFDKFKKLYVANSDIEEIQEEHLSSLLSDLKNILIKHLSGNFNENLAYAVFFSLDSLWRELVVHERIRDKILYPKIIELKKAGIDNWREMIADDVHASDSSPNKELTSRELDVLKLVAAGYINKEIADKLGISLNTVLSHRKNITAKLGIKTVSGLTFYCISHGYMSMSDAIDW